MDEKKPLISIIVPVYNVEDYIEGLQITVEKFVMIMF